MKLGYTQTFLASALASVPGYTSTKAADIDPADSRSIAMNACIYGSPMVERYRIMFSLFVDRAIPEYTAELKSSRNKESRDPYA